MLTLYNYFQTDYETAIGQFLDGLVRDVAANFTTYAFFQNRSALQSELETYITDFFTPLSITIPSFQVIDILLPNALTLEIENTATAIQDSQTALSERQVALVQFQTYNATVQGDIAIAILNRQTSVYNTLSNANNTASTLVSVYATESTALSFVKYQLNLTSDELLSYLFVKTLQTTSANVHLSVGLKPTIA